MTLSDQFGENITADEIEDATIETLQLWLPTYIAAMEERKDAQIPRPKQWQVVVDADRWAGEQLPSISVVSAGTSDAPRKSSGGTYDATFLTAVVWYVGGNNRDQIRRLNRWYAGIAREVLLQHAPKVGGVSCEVAWLGEEYDIVASDNARTLAAGRNVFEIAVDHVVERDAGPIEPVDEPGAPDAYPDEPTADEVFLLSAKLGD